MNYLNHFILIIVLIFSCLYTKAQETKLSQKQIKKLTECELVLDKKKLPAGYLYSIDNEEVKLFYNTQNDDQLKAVLVQQSYPTNRLKEAKVYTKKKRLLFAVLGAVIVGSAGYFALYEDQTTTDITGQNVKPGPNGEAILGGGLGAALGVSLGMALAKKKINFKENQIKAVEELKKWAQ